MTKNSQRMTSEEVFAAPTPNIERLTASINRITTVEQDLNSYELRNMIIHENNKEKICELNGRVLPESALTRQAEGQRFIQEAEIAKENKRKSLYSKGKTRTGTSGDALETEASLDIDHSRKLARNYRISNNNVVLPKETDAHHTVARADWRAAESREILYSVGIGINDADNCTILPRYRTTVILNMPNASNHQGVHTTKYYASVQAALLYIPECTQTAVRSALRRIASKLIAGTFPF